MSQVKVVCSERQRDISVDGKILKVGCPQPELAAHQIAAVLNAMNVENVLVIYSELGKHTQLLDR